MPQRIPPEAVKERFAPVLPPLSSPLPKKVGGPQTVLYLPLISFWLRTDGFWLLSTYNIYKLLRAYHGLSLSLEHLNEVGSVILTL